MTDRIHDLEVDTSEATVRALLEAERPDWAGLRLSFVDQSGTSNAMWRAHRSTGSDLAIRLPRTAGADVDMATELRLLPHLATVAPALRVPSVEHAGAPGPVFPHHWSVLTWIEGTDAWTACDELGDGSALAADLAATVGTIAAISDAPVVARRVGDRGGPFAGLVDRLERWLDDPMWNAEALLDVDRVRRVLADCATAADSTFRNVFSHGDLIPGNLLVEGGRLCAVIDWGGAGWADPAQDLAPAWSVLSGPARDEFRAALAIDDSTWLRAKAIELEHAVGGVLYYVPRGHQLGDVMSRTLDRILDD